MDPRLAAEALGIVAQLGDDELRVLTFIGKRLLAGQHTYGRMNLAGDPRDFDREAAEELADFTVYRAAREIQAALRPATKG